MPVEDRLNKALNDVPADPSPALENADPNPEASASPSGEPGSNEKDEKESGRTLDNVRGEFMRKLEQRDQAFASLQDEIRALRNDLVSKPEPAQSTPVDPSNKTVDQMSVIELRSLRSGLPEDTSADQVRQLDDYIIERVADEKARNIYQTESQRMSFTTQEKEANTKALDRWPELRNTTGALYTRTNQILQEMGTGADSNPAAILHAANEAGFELGLTPVGTITRQRPRTAQPTNVAGGSNAPVGGETAPTMSEEKMKDLSARLQNALPVGKKFDLKKIKERDKFYRENQQFYHGPQR